MCADRTARMNDHERLAWRRLREMGAADTEIGGFAALDLRSIKAATPERVARLLASFHEVAGRSGANRRHMDRSGAPVFVVSSDVPDRDESGGS